MHPGGARDARGRFTVGIYTLDEQGMRVDERGSTWIKREPTWINLDQAVFSGISMDQHGFRIETPAMSPS